MNLDKYVKPGLPNTKIKPKNPEIKPEDFSWQIPGPNSRYSLTHILTHLDKTTYENFHPNIQWPQTKFPVVNNYPNWINTLKLWPPLGTLTDYMIRKMIELLFPEKISHPSPSVAEKTNSVLDLAEKQGFNLPEFFEPRNTWTEMFKNASSWQEALHPASFMVNLDRIFREGISRQEDNIYFNERAFIPEMTLNTKQIQDLHLFFEKIFQFLKSKFTRVKQIFLNPPLGNEHYFKGDADLILDHLLLDIKTVKSPQKYFYSNTNQLLGYTAMQTWLQTYYETYDDINPERYCSLFAPRINFIGFFWPLHLKISVMKVESWTDTNRLEFLSALSNNSIS